MIFVGAAATIMAAVGPLAIESGNVELSAKIHCVRENPTDFSMQAACRRLYLSGAEDLRQIATRYVSDAAMQTALRTCVMEHRDEMALVDYSMAGACARIQERGYREMRGIPD